jgi:hypothetical protein
MRRSDWRRPCAAKAHEYVVHANLACSHYLMIASHRSRSADIDRRRSQTMPTVLERRR